MSDLFPTSFRPVQQAVQSSDGIQASLFAFHHSSTASKSGDVIVLLHGYPQNSTLWHEWIEYWSKHHPELLSSYDIVIPDLPGYGQSLKEPSPDGSHFAHSKRGSGDDVLALVDALYPGEPKKQVILIGHDRGARVAHRMARDHRDRIKGLCVQDITTTLECWRSMRADNEHHKTTHRMWHWVFLAVESDQPLDMLSSDPRKHHTELLSSWAAPKNRKGRWNERALESWIGQFEKRSVIIATLEDYRAGARIDIEHDEQDMRSAFRGKVDCPILAQYSEGLANAFDLSVWDELSDKVQREQIGTVETVGHYVPIEGCADAASSCAKWIESL